MLISSVLKTGDIVATNNKGITNRHFHVYEDEWRWLERFYTRHGRCPSRTTFLSKFADFPVRAADDPGYWSDEVIKEHGTFLFTNMTADALDHIDTGDIGKAIAVMQTGLALIESSLSGESAEFSLLNDAELIYADLVRRTETAKAKGRSGLPTGFPSLDAVTGGFQPGEYWVVGARLGVGKSWTLNKIVTTMMIEKLPSLYVTLEQSSNDVIFRLYNLLSSAYGRRVFRSTDLRSGRGFSLLEVREFLNKLKSLSLGEVFLADGTRGRVTTNNVAALIQKNRPAAAFIDYITLMDSKEKDWQSVGKLSSELQGIARRYDTPVIAAAQINRGGAGKEPPTADQLAMADSIGQDVDGLITLAQQTPTVLKFRLAKARNCESGLIWYAEFDPGRGHYGEISGDRAQELIDRSKEED